MSSIDENMTASEIATAPPPQTNHPIQPKSNHTTFSKFFHVTSQKRFWTITTGFLELFMICHGIDSYSSIEYVSREQNFFPGNTEDELKIIYARLLTICLVTAFFLQFSTTVLNDTYGMWFYRSVLHVSQVAGLVVALVMTPDTSWMAYLAYPLYYGAGGALITSNVLCFELFPKARGGIMSLIGVPILGSQVWYLWYVELGSDWKYFWVMLACFLPFSVARTFLLCPRYKVIGPKTVLGWASRNLGRMQNKSSEELKAGDENKTFETFETDNSGQIESEKNENDHSNPETSDSAEKIPTPDVSFKTFVKEGILNPNTALLTVWYFFMQLRYQTFISQYQSFLRFKTDDDEEVKTYTEAYATMLMVGCTVNIAFAVIIDPSIITVQKRLKVTHRRASYLVSVLGMVFSGIFGVVLTVTMIPEDLGWQTWFGIYFYVLGAVSMMVFRYIFIMSVYKAEFSARVLGFTFLIQLADALVTPQMSRMVIFVFDDDFNVYQYMSLVSIGVAVLAILATLFFNKK